MNEPQKPNDDWLREPGRSPVFQEWMNSLESKKVKRASQNVYLPEKISINRSTLQ